MATATENRKAEEIIEAFGDLAERMQNAFPSKDDAPYLFLPWRAVPTGPGEQTEIWNRCGNRVAVARDYWEATAIVDRMNGLERS